VKQEVREETHEGSAGPFIADHDTSAIGGIGNVEAIMEALRRDERIDGSQAAKNEKEGEIEFVVRVPGYEQPLGNASMARQARVVRAAPQ